MASLRSQIAPKGAIIGAESVQFTRSSPWGSSEGIPDTHPALLHLWDLADAIAGAL